MTYGWSIFLGATLVGCAPRQAPPEAPEPSTHARAVQYHDEVLRICDEHLQAKLAAAAARTVSGDAQPSELAPEWRTLATVVSTLALGNWPVKGFTQGPVSTHPDLWTQEGEPAATSLAARTVADADAAWTEYVQAPSDAHLQAAVDALSALHTSCLDW